LEDVPKVGLDRLCGDGQGLGDLAVGHPLSGHAGDALAQIAAGVETAGVAVDQLADARQDDATGSLGFHPQGVPRLEARLAEWGGGYRHLVLAGNPRLVLYLLSHR
jgi:hypothetical protein